MSCPKCQSEDWIKTCVYFVPPEPDMNKAICQACGYQWYPLTGEPYVPTADRRFYSDGTNWHEAGVEGTVSAAGIDIEFGEPVVVVLNPAIGHVPHLPGHPA